MNTNYLRAFVIASTIIVVFPHYLAVASLDKTKISYTYEDYTIIAPIYYGLMNMISLYLAIKFNLSPRQRYLLIGTLSPIIVFSFSYYFKTYTYNRDEWTKYFLGLFIKHFLIWNVVIYLLNKYV
jgi:hypothetical protein